MKISLNSGRQFSDGYALLMVLGVTAISLIVLAATMSRTSTVAKLNERNNQHQANLNAAEAAVEKVYARMAYDFQAYGPVAVAANQSLYRTSVPLPVESPYWEDFEFSDGQGNLNCTYVEEIADNYTGPLPSQYPGLMAVASPVYRIVSNVKSKTGNSDLTTAVQEDVLLATVPLTTYAIFYNGLLEFSTCASMEVRGRVHANGPIYVGAGQDSDDGQTLKFFDTVTTTETLTAPHNAGHGWDSPYVFDSSKWKTYFYGNPTYKTNVPSVSTTLPMTNTHALIEIPPASEIATSMLGKQRMYNKAHVLLLVSNDLVNVTIQHSVGGLVPGADQHPKVLTYSFESAETNLPFLSLSNVFYDQREDRTNVTAEIDIAGYSNWITTSPDVLDKFHAGSSTYPTILFVSDSRTITSQQMNSVRLVNGANLPLNGGLGFTVATPDPLYVIGNYNAPNPASTNTSAALPAALMSDALTVLSSNWEDANSFDNYDQNEPAFDATTTTLNAAILTGIVPSTGSGHTEFSGGVHNLVRLLEDWSGNFLWLNTSIISLYDSTKATNQFRGPWDSDSYYAPPTREFSFDTNFLNPDKRPPGVPAALLPIRFNWAVPPAGTVTYNVNP